MFGDDYRHIDRQVPFQGVAVWEKKKNSVASSQSYLIMSAIYFLIHLPHRETTFPSGGGFVANPLGDDSVVQIATL